MTGTGVGEINPLFRAFDGISDRTRYLGFPMEKAEGVKTSWHLQ
jgi:hypothetical protein